MTVDVLYEGLAIVTGAPARTEGEGLFVELETPMPVGTRLVIRDGSGERPARVEHVHEGVGPGVLVHFSGAAVKISAPAAATEKSAAPPEPEKIAEPAPVEKTESAAPAEEPPDQPKGGRKRKNTRKTVIGH